MRSAFTGRSRISERLEHVDLVQKGGKYVVDHMKDPAFMLMGADVGIGIRSPVQLFDRLACNRQEKIEIRIRSAQTTDKRLP